MRSPVRPGLCAAAHSRPRVSPRTGFDDIFNLTFAAGATVYGTVWQNCLGNNGSSPVWTTFTVTIPPHAATITVTATGVSLNGGGDCLYNSALLLDSIIANQACSPPPPSPSPPPPPSPPGCYAWFDDASLHVTVRGLL